jgi:hypothetical protein
MDGAINIHVYDANHRPLKGAEVSIRGKHKGQLKSLGQATTLGFSDRPVRIQWSGKLDDPYIEVHVSYAGEEQQARVHTDGGDHTFIMNYASDDADSNAGLGYLGGLIDRAIKAVPRVRFAMGVVGVGAAAAIINAILGLNRLAFVSILAMFAAMILLYIFSRIEHTTDPVVKFGGRLLVIVTVVVFAVFLGSSLAAAVVCWPRVFVYLYGIESECGLPPKHVGRSENQRAIARKLDALSMAAGYQ